MLSIRPPVQVPRSGLILSLKAPYLGASPNAKVVDAGCSDPLGLSEVKCPETKFFVTPLDACSDSNFFLEDMDSQHKLKRNHKYYAQVQGLMGVTGALKSYYFTQFLSKEANPPTHPCPSLTLVLDFSLFSL